MEQWLLDLLGSAWVHPGLFAFAALDGFFPPVPSESAVIAVASVAAATGAPDLRLVVLAAALGAWVGDQVAYAIGRRVDVRSLRVLRGARAQRAVDRAEAALARRPAALLLAARYVPVGRVAVNMTAGAVRYPWRRFAAVSALGGLLWSLWSTLLGVAAGAWLHGRPLVAVAVGVVGGLLVGLGVDRVAAAVSRRRRRRGAAAPRAAGRPGSGAEAAGAPASGVHPGGGTSPVPGPLTSALAGAGARVWTTGDDSVTARARSGAPG
ncbi:DedA family protein [Cellulomonas marina]|uniref:Membrane protein DedA, SNARE-associated domain n=1 Tax=Cellulomonas marina TaxID=988821 RepID=A0A1I0XS01_9CELL|nr:VTT domain-containing protein [Cellulomonas marina]SFB02968.1 membrane protein DedA, SNARE-associated domain [Cellulomonas marina]